jgi:hypothetical protein
MKLDGIYDEFVWLHNEVALLTHETEQFLPWHRYVSFQDSLSRTRFSLIPYSCGTSQMVHLAV